MSFSDNADWLNNDQSTEDMELILREMLLELSIAFTKKGFPVVAFRESTWEDFRKFPIERKKKIYSDISNYSALYLPVLQMAGSPNEDGRLIWAGMKKYGLSPDAEFFNHLEESDIVEFYDGSGLQIFHNINFFDVCSYTFLEIFSYPFTELWTRDEVTFAQTKQVLIDGFSGKFQGTVDANLPRQYLIEAFSEERYIIELDFTKFSPLYSSNGAMAALAVVSRGRVIDPKDYDQILKARPTLPRPPRQLSLLETPL